MTERSHNEAALPVELKACPNPWCEREFPPKACRHLCSTKWYVHCDTCGFDGPTGSTEAEAIAAWNTRPVVSEAVPREPTEAMIEAGDAEYIHGARFMWPAMYDAYLSQPAQPSDTTGEVEWRAKVDGSDWEAALDSAIDSHKKNELAGWELDLVRRRVRAALAAGQGEQG